MEYFIPRRENREKYEIKNNYKESFEEIFLKKYGKLIFIEKDKELRKYLENEKFIEVINEIKNKENKKALNLAQFKRFYSFVKDKNFDFFDKKVKDFIKKQKERKIAIKFYEFIETKFINEIKEDENKKDEKSLEAKQKLEIIEKYLLYVFGEERINEKLKK